MSWRPNSLRHLIKCSFQVLLPALLSLLPQVQAQRVEVVILQTSDLHGYINESGVAEAGGGWLRIASLIREERGRTAADRLLLIDCGDTAQGSFIGAVSKGEVVVPLLQTLQYDVWVPGNHELDFGIRQFHKLISAVDGQVLCGNFRYRIDARAQRLRAWRLFNRGGARIAVIGTTARYLNQWLWGEDMEGFEVDSTMQTLVRVLPEVLRARPDMIILATHQGWLPQDTRKINEIEEIAQTYPEIDLILGGHTHQEIPGLKIGHRTWYVQPGKYATGLSRTVAVIDIERHEVIDIESTLIPAASDVPIDAAAARAVAQWQRQADRIGKQVVGQMAAECSAAGLPAVSCEISELLCRVLAHAVDADVVFHGKLSELSLWQGKVTERDLFSIVPYENSIAPAFLTVAEIAEIMSEQVLNRNSYVYNGIWGAEAVVSANGEVRSLRVNGRDRAPEERIKVAFNSYTVAGGGGRFRRLREIVRQPEANLRDSGIQTRAALGNYIRHNSPLKIEARQWLRLQQ